MDIFTFFINIFVFLRYGKIPDEKKAKPVPFLPDFVKKNA